MISYYGYTISPNQIETGEGFLICRNVPIARTGDQDYLGAEMGYPDKDVIKVNRPESEVFSAAALASFEGKPFTNDHPPVLVDPENCKEYEVGHVQNVRRGSGEFKDFMIADLHVHGKEAIEAIQNGKRQISCGYECECVANEDGTYTQKNIRGNHVALVDEGRAGAKAAIMDSNKAQAELPPERIQKMSRTEKFLHLFGLASNGKTADEISKLALDTAEALEADPADACGKDEQTTETGDAFGKDSGKTDADPIAELSAKIDKLVEIISAKADAEKKPEKDSDPIEAAIAEMGEKKEEEEASATDPNGEEARVVPAEEMDEDPEDPQKIATVKAEKTEYQDSVAILKAMRESIAKISNEEERKAVTDALLGSIRKPVVDSDAAKIAKAAANNAAVKQNSAVKMDIDAVQKAYDALNPHMRKETK
jgi:hypothetical protein